MCLCMGTLLSSGLLYRYGMSPFPSAAPLASSVGHHLSAPAPINTSNQESKIGNIQPATSGLFNKISCSSLSPHLPVCREC